jgi:NAD-dependent deacetylase
MTEELNTSIEKAARTLAKCRRGVALTGAGVSVESGIPDFRSKGGLWTKFPPEEYAHIQAFRRDPVKIWRMLAEMEAVLDGADPNPGHIALAELEEAGILDGIITQNIDGLHQEAGSEKVVEFHGSHRTLSCLACGGSYTRKEAQQRPTPPPCDCGALLKPDVIFFGEMIPADALDFSNQWVQHCRVMLVAGTSAEVVPASQMPLIAKQRGAVVIEINVEPTLLTRSVTDIFLRGKTGEILPQLSERVRALI